MRRTLVAALCLCACCLGPDARAEEPRPDEDLTTWVRMRLDEHMSLLGKPLESWIGSVEGHVDAANIRYAVDPEIGHGLLAPPPTMGLFQSIDGIYQHVHEVHRPLHGPVASLPNHTNYWLTGGSGLLGYRFASDTEFFLEMRYLDGTQGDARTSLYTPRLATKMNFSFDEWRLSVATGLRGLFSNSTFGTGQDTIQTTATTNTTVTTTTPGSLPITGGYIPGTSNTVQTITPISTLAVVPSRRQSNINGGGTELGLGVERDFADTGLSAFVRPRAAGLYTGVDRAVTYNTPDFGPQVAKTSNGVWFLETGLSLGATWRPTFAPRLQVRVAYDFEHYFCLNRNLFGQGVFLTGNSLLAGLDYSF